MTQNPCYIGFIKQFTMTRSRSVTGAHHERLSSSEASVVVSSDRVFGLVFAGIFAFIWIVPLLRGRPVRWWSFAVSLFCLIFALVSPSLLHRLNLIWARLALVLHRVVNPVVMALVFYLAFTPMGLLLRAFGKDLLYLKPAPEADSYWIPCDPPGPPPNTMIQQF